MQIHIKFAALDEETVKFKKNNMIAQFKWIRCMG